MTLFTTILAGVSVFVLGQVFLKWVIEPIQDLRKVIAEILFYLANDHSIIHNAEIVNKEEALSVGKNLERLGARLLANQNLIPFYDKTRKVFGLSKRESIAFASKRLSLISKSMFGKEDIHCKLDLYRINVCESLGIDDPIQSGMTKQALIDGIEEMRSQKRA